jgi:Rrf2 family transcriptional repressor of oqxAB
MIDVRFPTALQIVLSLAVAMETDARCTSAELAAGLGTNPVLVRKLLAQLAPSGIVVSTPGKNGGVRLGRSPELITLRDVYTAVVDDKKLLTVRSDVPSVCVVSTNITEFFGIVADRVDEVVLGYLEKATVAESLANIREIDLQRRDV